MKRCDWVAEAHRIWTTVPTANKGWRTHIASLPYSPMDKAGILEKLTIAWNGRNSTVAYMGMTAENLYAEKDG